MKIRHALPFVAAAALLMGLSPVASGAPSKNPPTTKPQPKPTPPGPGFIVVDGFITSMGISANGEIIEFTVKEMGQPSNAVEFRVKGCGIKQVDSPVLLLAFERYRRVWINVDTDSKCYLGLLVESPGKS
jgi:hypothetical protein